VEVFMDKFDAPDVLMNLLNAQIARDNAKN
jgi:pyruvate decarboxylase